MKNFDQWMTRHQVAWRAAHIPCNDWGAQNGKYYPWILPTHQWQEGLWGGIHSGSSNSLPNYLINNQVQKHEGCSNLKSSWMHCANLYFSFRVLEEGKALLANFLHRHVFPEIRTVDSIELEYAEKGKLHPSILLGETGGWRGSGQTSPDLGLLVNGGRGLVLVENKLLEHSFYQCSARRTSSSSRRAGNPDPSRCDDALAVAGDPISQCHQAAWGRRYWEHLAPVANPETMATLAHCPAAHTGYQILRQQALAEGIMGSGKYEFVVSCVAMDARNDALQNSLRRTGLSTVADWGHLFRGKAHFAVFTHQQWVGWVPEQDTAHQWGDWLSYVESRYGYGQ